MKSRLISPHYKELFSGVLLPLHPIPSRAGLRKHHDYCIMAPKGKAGDKGAAGKDKGKGKGKADTEEKGGKVKGAQYINVRHILVRCFFNG